MGKGVVVIILLLFSNSFFGQTPVFSNITASSGIQDATELSQPFGYGASLADFDNDGDIDFFLATDSGIPNRLYRNDGQGIFLDIASEVGLASLKPSNASLWFDYNGDRLLDLLVVGNCIDIDCDSKIMVSLYQQTLDGYFTETTEQAGLTFGNIYDSGIANPLITTGGLSAGDINNDGFLDLFITFWKGKSSFFLNNTDGTFSNISSSSLLDTTTKDYWQPMFYDFNKDGFQDLYINVDFKPNELWLNKGDNTFDEVASTAGVNGAFNEMGIALGDYDNDGDFDIYATNITIDGKYNILLENNSQGNSLKFTEVSRSLGVSDSGWDWGTTFFDANNDGWLDLATTNGYISYPADKSRLWINNQGESYADVSNASGFNDNLFATTLLAFDMDRDGDLDLLQTLKENESNNKPVLLYENSLNNNSNAGNFIVIKPRMYGSNHYSIGATIKIKSNNLRGTRLISAGTSFYGQEPAEAFFGLGTNNNVEEIRIEWPDNTVTILKNVEANQVLTVTNETTVEDIPGCTDFNSCNYNPLATIDDGSCQYGSSNEISGPKESGLSQIETYVYVSDNNSQLKWNVEGGKIINGQDTNSISVKWGLSENGKVSVTEQSESCFNSTKTLDVTLNIYNRPQDISIARVWNEVLLEAIRNDFARPTVHARNLFHSSVAMYDIWAVYHGTNPYLLGNEVHDFTSTLKNFIPKEDIDVSLTKSISYAMYRLLNHRFRNSPGADESLSMFKSVMDQLGYDTDITSTDYESGEAANFGNYVAQTLIDYGLNDNSRETTDYDNSFYSPVNPSLDLDSSTYISTGVIDPNRWQPLKFTTFVDQSGNLISESTPTFLSPEWGNVKPFALLPQDKDIFSRDGFDFTVYHNPNVPPKLNSPEQSSKDNYKWNFSLVSIWGSHLDPTDGVMWDISPKSIGNVNFNSFPDSFTDYSTFYDELNGGDVGNGHSMNPKTGNPYEEQIVPRGDYTRVLAEFWADGPDSETPPGHWFTILNYVTDHELFTRKFNGKGDELNILEWDVKSYFILGGAMHDSAVSAWSIKGWHDYIRPISAIRYMCELGQSSDTMQPNYHPDGIKLKDGYIEVIGPNDSLSGNNGEHIGKIKLYSWLGHSAINNSETDVAGVGWVLAENWWPYQRPSFVTPPFAGYVSGHSTFSRAAAEVLTLITGDEYFPGGMGEFVAKKDEFLVFEKGPSVDIKLQWATYKDASDQTSLSRIWGGIHPPVDDIPGRVIGRKIGLNAYNYALPYFEKNKINYTDNKIETLEAVLFPNPVANKLFINAIEEKSKISIFSMSGQLVMNGLIDKESSEYDLSNLPIGVYAVKISNEKQSINKLIIKK
ncbi:FG-GAP-like repeat-containing protein [Costertonia aggregata]|uniref:VCBS repeat-containing protein n=1 Tax=Costertonia aggregata TaxID=343403 RepID=A0A7H9AR80_9FLAO|nr:FG-GAP-like repeat-containing protein [Costertonia aggregata]QLG45940.1 VCBS repeat-containing protein [Costertonia aggregata]